MSRMWNIVAVVGVAAVAGYASLAAVKGKKETLALLFGPIERKPVDFLTLELRDSPNQYLVCPPDYCRAQPHAEAPTFNSPPADLRRRWFRMIGEQPRVTLLSSDHANEQYEFEALTALLGFPDTVTVRFLPHGENGSTLAVYSRSHYGHSDMGVNEKRVKLWLEKLRSS